MAKKKLEELTDNQLLKILKISGKTSKDKKTLKSAGYHVAERSGDYNVKLSENKIYGDTIEISKTQIVKIPWREHNKQEIPLKNQFQVAKYLIEQGYNI
jgi:hypothetical protein